MRKYLIIELALFEEPLANPAALTAAVHRVWSHMQDEIADAGNIEPCEKALYIVSVLRCDYRLAYCLMFPILLYGADLYSPTKGLLSRMDVHWRQVQRWVTNCFRSIPIPIMAAESCLPPLCVLLKHKRPMAVLRLVFSPLTINPASARPCRTLPSLLKAMTPDSRRALCTQVARNIMPLNCKTPLPSPPMPNYLPVDALAYRTISLLEGLSYAPLISSTLLPDLLSLHTDEIMVNAYKPLRRKAQSLMMDHWRSIPLPDYYSYPLRLAPNPFIGLEKFIAGHINQMRAQMSYQATHPFWFNASDSPLCLLYANEPESFSHVILHCPTKATARARYLLGVSSVGPDAPL